MARTKDDKRKQLIEAFMRRSKGKQTPADMARGPRPGQGANATFSYSGRTPPPARYSSAPAQKAGAPSSVRPRKRRTQRYNTGA